MKRAIEETNRRREIQNQYNVENGIVPKTIEHQVENTLEITVKQSATMTVDQLKREISNLTQRMKTAASQLDFEQAIVLREQVAKLSKKLQKAQSAKKGNK